jgi:hypothetical protein
MEGDSLWVILEYREMRDVCWLQDYSMKVSILEVEEMDNYADGRRRRRRRKWSRCRGVVWKSFPLSGEAK